MFLVKKLFNKDQDFTQAKKEEKALSSRESKILKESCALKGWLKKKRKKKLTAFFSSSVKRYFRFFNNGRYLCYFDKEPDIFTKPKNLIYIEDIKEVIQNHEKKKDHFLIHLKSGKTVQLKATSVEKKNDWAKAVSKILQVYKKKKELEKNSEVRQYKEKIDPYVMLDIMNEIEQANIDKFVQENQNQILKDKDVYSYIEDLGKKMKENRVFYSRIMNTNCDQLKIESKENSKKGIGNTIVYPNKFLWDGLFALIILRKSYVD